MTRPSPCHRLPATVASVLVLPAAMLLPFSAAPAPAADADPVMFPPVTVSATGFGREAFEMPYATAVLTDTALGERMPRSLPGALEALPGLMIQKTGTAQGSPYLRGFTGFRTLLLVDGIRLNNSVFREGPNQYWGTVDPQALGQLEIVKGPGSVVYGSDAVGGTVNAVSRVPESAPAAAGARGRAWYRFASADRSHSGRLELAGNASARLAGHLAVTRRKFGDLRAGRATGLQPRTGYSETGFDGSLRYRPTPHRELVALLQEFRQDDAWRTHTTVYGGTWEGTRPGNDLQRSLDQRRRLLALQYRETQRPGPIDQLHLSVSQHRQQEDQLRRRNDGRREDTGFGVETLGAFLQAQSRSEVGRWVGGGEFYRDRVDSHSLRYRADGVLSAVDIQGPVAGHATYDLAGVYLENRARRFGPVDLVAGVRLNHAAAQADRVRDPATGRPTRLRADWTSLVGGLRGVVHLDAAGRHNLFAGIGEGFRAPNLSDLTRFDIAEGGQIETPAPRLAPERSVTGEIGWRTRQPGWSAEVAFFHTAIRNQIIRTPTGARVDGLDEVTKRNSGAGDVHGLELAARGQLAPGWTLWGNGTWMRGNLDYYPSADATLLARGPMSRVMPPTLHAGVRWDAPGRSRRWFGLQVSAAGHQDRLAPNDRVDTERIPAGGTPGYLVAGLHGGWQPAPSFTLTVALENLADVDYRIHGSGVNEPGRNLVLAAELRF